MKLKTIAATAALLMLPAISQAGDVAGFATSGYIDFSGQINDWDDGGTGQGLGGGSGLGFTNIGNDGDFSLNQAALKLTKTPTSGFGGVLGIIGGDAASAITANAGGGDLRLSEGYLQYTNGMLTVIGGKFFTLAGYEVFASTGNAQATRGLLFQIQPLSLTGVRGTMKFGDAFSASLGAVNEIDGDTTESGEDQKAIELNVALNTGGFTAALTHYKTSEQQALFESVPTALTDLVLGFTAGAFNVGFNADVLTFDDPSDTEVTGLALYAGFAFTDAFRLSGRYETITTEDNTLTPDVDRTSLTLTAGLALSKEFDLLAEVRSDEFDDGAGSETFGPAGDTDDSGSTAVLKGIFKF